MRSTQPGPSAAGLRLVDVAGRLRADLSPANVERLSVTPAAQPNLMRAVLADVLGRPEDDIVVTGTIERRLVLVRRHDGDDTWTVAELSGAPLASRDWPSWAADGIVFDRDTEWLSSATLHPTAVRRLLRPRILLAALYHPEYFPLPRFPLGISDVARAARLSLAGRVELLDMQLGVDADDIVERVRSAPPDILGISATFGQHDLMDKLLTSVYADLEPPLVIAGGSLTARNERILLDRFPALLVARGGGEDTIQDVIAYWHGDVPIDGVRGIGYVGASNGPGTLAIGRQRRTASASNRTRTDIFPELDLLDETFARHGVAQLEASRGCTNYCSFCPRGHKGTWGASETGQLSAILAEMNTVFEAHRDISRTVYLVDEEFIGDHPDAVGRARGLADALHGAGFQWETSCRIDQVVDPGEGSGWHHERAEMWRYLVSRGLRRCLFGVESGVNSVLLRFNKETTGEQNALAIRTLSALGVPTRFTYITFDHLMTADELRATCQFQARTDLLLQSLPEASVEEIVRGVRDPAFVAAHSLRRPLYTGISYPLVSMECLIGAAYTRAVQAAGLAGEPEPAMGRIAARYLDRRIGRCSHHAQLWVDRNFALDYTLKSLEKILDGVPRTQARQARVVIKRAGAAVLEGMVGLVDGPDLGPDGLDRGLATLLDRQLAVLKSHMASTIAKITPTLPASSAAVLAEEFVRWNESDGWHLINANENCVADSA